MCKGWIVLKCNKEQWNPRHIFHELLKANPENDFWPGRKCTGI